MIRTLAAVVGLSVCGCTLIVGTDTRVVGDGGASADASAVPACPSSKGCLDAQSQCRADCNGKLSACEQNCPTGPKGDKCVQDCKCASETCVRRCTSDCSSCASAAGCDPRSCQS